ncbi:hypothetical protein, partial [Micromonospora gifhornensis]|uniref:hypothetical protein n=1 Tax=Micromonospora gifhornensis TaxID=84594 RepID=UPI0031D58C44
SSSGVSPLIGRSAVICTVPHLAERRDEDRRKPLRKEPHATVLQVRPEMIGGTVIRDEGGKLRQYVVSHRSGCSSTTDS